ncbi:MAG: TolC family protein [bacterium]|nr:TolC family protein [bacterium]
MIPRLRLGLGLNRRLGLIGLLALLAGVGCAGGNRFERMNDPQAWRAAMQPPLTHDEATSLSRGIVLHEILPLAMRRNPGIEAQRRNWLAAIHVEPQAASLPDPMIEGGVQLDSPMPGTDRQWNVGIRQELPWWRKLWARAKIAGVDSDVARLRYEAAARDLIVEIKDAYYELYYLDTAIPITRKVEQMLKNEGLLAYSGLTTGRTELNDALYAESQAAQLGYDRILLEEQRATQAERLRALLNLPPNTTVGPVATAPVYEINADLNALFQRAEAWSEALRTRGLEVEKARYETYMAKLERIPDVSLGWMYQANVPGMMGKSMRAGLGAINLPIWEQRNRALVREKQAAEEAMTREALEETNNTRKAVAQAYFEVSLTDRLVTLYAQVLLPQAEAVMRQVEIDFRADQAAFSSVLETTLAYHNFLLAYQRAAADHGQAIGRLEKVLGTTAESHDESPMKAHNGERVTR